MHGLKTHRATRFARIISASANSARTCPTCACSASPQRATPLCAGASKRSSASVTSPSLRMTRPQRSASPSRCASMCARSAACVDVRRAVASGPAAETRPCSTRHVERRPGRFWCFPRRGRRASGCARHSGQTVPKRRLRYFFGCVAVVLPCISYPIHARTRVQRLRL